MDASRQYRQQENFCLRLASVASEEYVRVALTELATDYHQKADDAERHRQHTQVSSDLGRNDERRAKLLIPSLLQETTGRQRPSRHARPACPDSVRSRRRT
jgi:hypothetical protein